MTPNSPAPTNLVPHPIFGVAYSPESGFPADLSRQKPSPCPILFYVDMLTKCRNCLRPFVFHAREQKYWYEDLGFDLGARCPARCPECRRSRRRLHRHFQRYSELSHQEDLTDTELGVLVGDSIVLYKAGILEDEQRLRRLKNLALTRLAGEQVTQELVGVIAAIPVVGGHRLGVAESRLLESIRRLIDAGMEVVSEVQALAATLPADNLDLGSVPSYAKAFERLRRRGLLTDWVQDKSGRWGVRPITTV
ncbi:zinc-ribbon domain containing protein [Singulisphaera rosea]